MKEHRQATLRVNRGKKNTLEKEIWSIVNRTADSDRAMREGERRIERENGGVTREKLLILM